ncbi:hypothetical protein RCJ22_20110 [Vibrio sp. FNV 38]|nr:hypothetical protein [Vibrio sp. FNV 38]
MYHFESQISTAPSSFNKTNSLAIPQCVFTQLSRVSKSHQWIFFTAQCPRPTYGECLHYSVDVDKVMQIKASHRFTELEVVTRALQTGNASAIVSSGLFSTIEKHCLKSLAIEHKCQIVFLNENTETSIQLDTVH